MVKYFLPLSFLFLSTLTLSTKAQIGIGTLMPNPSAQLDVTSTTRGFLPPRMDSMQRNAIVSPQAGLTIYNTSSKAFECFNGVSWYSTVHFIGESYGGGIVFFVYDNGQHGLISALPPGGNDPGIRWNAGVNKYTMALGGGDVNNDGFGVGAGKRNTNLIIASQGYGDGNNYAALYCSTYKNYPDQVQFEDWYLPSVEELYLLWLQRTTVGGFQAISYCSSTEGNMNYAWVVDFASGLKAYRDKTLGGAVRPIRAF
ncbi:MAG: hypothetical protein ABI691_20420 [Ginsengibacter sp.]